MSRFSSSSRVGIEVLEVKRAARCKVCVERQVKEGAGPEMFLLLTDYSMCG